MRSAVQNNGSIPIGSINNQVERAHRHGSSRVRSGQHDLIVASTCVDLRDGLGRRPLQPRGVDSVAGVDLDAS